MKAGDPRVPARLWAKVLVLPDGCWQWTASCNRAGYGRAFWDGKAQLAHRVFYALAHGTWPPMLDHRCRRRACVNPAHLEPVDARENTRRGLRGDLVTACPRGHSYAPGDGHVYVRHDGRRQCNTCMYERMVGKPNPDVLCACGCGETRQQFNRFGRPARFIPGHNLRAA